MNALARIHEIKFHNLKKEIISAEGRRDVMHGHCTIKVTAKYRVLLNSILDIELVAL